MRTTKITEENQNYLSHHKGLKSWLFTLDHKRIGLMFLGAILSFFLLGGLLALGVRLELFAPGKQLMDADTYNKFFTMHGMIMVFLFIVPSTPSALGNFVLPMMVGAKDVAFPRLNLLSFYVYLAGALLALSTLIFGGLDTGWTFYTPYSSQIAGPVIIMGLAVFIMGFSSILTGLNFVVTIHKLRAPGMTWFDMPLFLWAMYATSVIQILATPVIGITMLLLVFERAFGIGIFDPQMGGDPVLFQHFFWFYSHPVVYIMILPAMGIVSELIAVFSHKKIFGYKPIAYSSVAIAGVSFLVWGHHMFVSGQSSYAAILFSLLTFAVAVPTAIKVFSWIATMYKGSIDLKTPMIYALSFLFLFTIGGLTGVFLGAIAVDVHLHDTYFVVAHFHYVMFGGAVVAFLGGLHYWWPKMTGKMYNECWGRIGAVLVWFSFNLTFMPQFIAGFKGMPRRYYNYDASYEIYNQLSTIGSTLLGIGFFIVAINLLMSLKKSAAKAPDNPWGALTLEWESSSPPYHENFREQPVLKHGPYDFEKVEVEA
ncbi:MAG TPA: cytochrome c oxidase subunit I [Oligoflexia bacterium]|nr:cytochrome c oxidase subunit I [Oligoflexia bacterium]HMR24567.1 cytochrome c oxidase subunit I [Oligoflexia bacterium]